MAVVTKFPSSLSLAQAVLLVFLFLAASLNRCRSSPASSGLPSSADGGQQPAALTEQEAVNMNVSNLGEALFFISGVFISAVQPQPSPKVALQWLFPRVRLVSDRIRSFPTIFDIEKAKWSASSVEVSPVMTWLKIGQLGPGDVLQALCNDTLGKNVVTVLHVNNPTVSRDFRDISRYLTQLLDSIGVPVISWDPDFSTSLQPERTLQLAPTIYHQTETMLAFMKKFKWKFFSMITTQVTGASDFFSSLRHQASLSRQQNVPNIYGQAGFQFKILSAITLLSSTDKELMKEQLTEEMDPDTRIILLHCTKTQAYSVIEVAEEMGLTGREYVWILSTKAIGGVSDGTIASRSLPLGIFGVTFDSEVEYLVPVLERSTKIWLQALENMDRDGVIPTWEWDTKMSCNDGQLKKWPGGRLLFDYMRNVSIPIKAPGDVATEFNEMGMVTYNKLSILNVISGSDYVSPSASPSRSPGFNPGGGRSPFGRGSSRGSFGQGSSFGRGNSGGSPFGRGNAGRSPFGRGNTGGSSLGSSGLRKFPSRGSRPSSRDNSQTGNGSDSGLASKSSLSRGSSSPFNRGSSFSKDNRRFPSRSNSSASRKTSFASSSSRLSSSSLRGRNSPSSSSSLSSSSSSSSSSLLSASSGRFKSDRSSSGTSSRFGSNRFGSRNRTNSRLSSFPRKTLGPSVSPDPFSGKADDMAMADESSDSRTRQLIEDRRSRHKKARRHLLRHHRRPRSLLLKKRNVFQKVASWDGKDLNVVGIVWPGNSTYPPKGVPESYHLDVATYIEAPHVTYKPPGEKGHCDLHATVCSVYERDENDIRYENLQPVKMCCSGLSIDILYRLSKELNFNFSLFEVDSESYGSVDETNSSKWTGLVGAVVERRVDLAIAALSITPEREEVIDFSVPFLETGITIVVALREGAISPTAFLEPYDYPSWTLILVFSVHATGASIFIFEWLSPYGLDSGHTPLRVHKFSLFRSFWLIWAMLFGAAVSTNSPRGVSSKFLANIWALFAVVFLASYTANLAAFMITKEKYYDLSGIQDWRLKNPHHRHPPFKYATMPGGATETNIRNNYPELYGHMKKYPQNTVKEAVQALKDQKIQAFIYDATTLEYAVGRDVGCKLKSVGQRYAETGYGVGFPKKSRWVKKFNEVLLRMQDDGEMERLQKFWLAGACHKKRQTRGTSSHTLGILNFTSAFILLGGGVVLGALLLMLEHIYFRFGRKSLRKWDKCGCCSLVSLSMGQSLTFEQSVMEAIDMHKHHKCRDPLCETQLWKAKHELDIAMLKIDQLKRQLAKQTAEDGDVGDEEAGQGPPVWTYDPDATLQKDGVPRKRAIQSSTPVSNGQGRKEHVQSPQWNGVETIGDTTAAPTKPTVPEKSDSSQPSSPRSDPDLTPPRTASRRTRVSDGRIYENVDGGIDIESTI